MMMWQKTRKGGAVRATLIYRHLKTLLLLALLCSPLSQPSQAEPAPATIPEAKDKPASPPPAEKQGFLNLGTEKNLSFGERLSSAALERTKSVVIYNPQYFKIPYPGGDVPDHYGVCSDVVIRAYRKLGIDLQKDVHQRLGGDRNIAHRRVRVLRRLFSRYGTKLKVTREPANYKPGDIVTYYIPEAIFSKDHIAIVTDKIGNSGAPMIVHNIGLGPKLDDDLFSWKITGHYRYGS